MTSEYPKTPKSIESSIVNAIDMDEWKYSWHIKTNDVDNYSKFIEIIDEKIQAREAQINFLKRVRQDLILIQREYQ
jgi:hypothetical protein